MTDTPPDSHDDPIEGLLAEILERPPSEHATELNRAATEHPNWSSELRDRYEALRALGMISDERADSIPERLGEFRLLKRIGGGGMGIVYAARQESLGRDVALKLIRPEHLFFPRARERFRRETEVVARLQHPNIVPIYTVGDDGGLPYYAMELLRGCSMAELLVAVKGRRVSELRGDDAFAVVAGSNSSHLEPPTEFRGEWWEFCVWAVRQIAAALHHAHERDVLHRDVKPSNILLLPDGRAMLVDFGLTHTGGTRDRVTRTGSQVGTLLYMSPEQVRGDDVDRRTDIYGLAVTLYELLTLRSPFEAASPLDLQREILESDAPSLRDHQPHLSRDLATVVSVAMDRDPRRRYATCLDFARDLGHVLALRPIEARPVSPGVRTLRWCQRNRTLASTVSLVLALIVVLPLALFLQQLSHNRSLKRESSARLQSLQREQSSRATAVAREREAIEARGEATQRAAEAHEALEFVLSLFRANYPQEARGEPRTALDLLNAGLRDMDATLAEYPELKRRFKEEAANILKEMGRWEEAEAAYRDILAAYQRDGWPDDPQVCQTPLSLGVILLRQGQFEEAEALLQQGLEVALSYADQSPISVARAHNRVATLYFERHQWSEAESHIRAALEISLPRVDQDDMHAKSAAMNRVFLAQVHMQTGENQQAMDDLTTAIADQEALLGELHPEPVKARVSLALALDRANRFDDAEEQYELLLDRLGRLWPEGSSTTMNALYNYGYMLAARDRLDEGALLMEQAAEMALRTAGPASQGAILAHVSLGTMRVDLGSFGTATPLLDEWLPRATERWGWSPNLAVAAQKRAIAHAQEGRLDVATDAFLETFDAWLGLEVGGSALYAAAQAAVLAQRLMRDDDVEELLERALDVAYELEAPDATQQRDLKDLAQVAEEMDFSVLADEFHDLIEDA